MTAQGEAPDYRVLSAGAVRRAIEGCMDAFAAETGTRGTAWFDTAPAVRAAVQEGTAAEVIVAPNEVLRSLRRANLTAPAPRAVLGEVVAGAVVRVGAPVPDLSTVEALAAAIAGADAVVFNRASSGRGLAALLARLGAAAAAEGRVVQVENGAAVVRAVASGAYRNAIGFAQSTEIRRLIEEGAAATFAGPLPAGAAVRTRYAAGCTAGPASRTARRFVRFLAGPEARRILDAAGIHRSAAHPSRFAR